MGKLCIDGDIMGTKKDGIDIDVVFKLIYRFMWG